MTPRDRARQELARRELLKRSLALADEHPDLVDRDAPAWSEDLGGLAAVLNSETEMAKKTVQVAFRLETDLVARLDKHAERMAEAMPGLTFTRVDALKALLIPALDAAERGSKKQRT